MFRMHMKTMILALLVALLLASCEGPAQPETDPVADLEGETAEETAVVPALPTPVTDTAFDCTAVSEIPVAECQALVSFYEATEGANWVDQTGWLQTNTPCSWYGVMCTDGHVDTLALYNNNLPGQLPTVLADLPQLRVLDLHNNAINRARGQHTYHQRYHHSGTAGSHLPLAAANRR